MRPLIIAAAVMIAAIAAPVFAAPQIEVGARIPAKFTALDATGKTRDYASIKGRKGTVLVLFRSAKWCPYCQAQLKGLQTAGTLAELAKRGYSLTALSYDPPATLASFAQRQGIAFTLLSDEKSAMIDALGLRDPAYPADSFAYGVPKASILVIDAKGVVRSKSVAADYKFRPTPEAVLASVNGIK